MWVTKEEFSRPFGNPFRRSRSIRSTRQYSYLALLLKRVPIRNADAIQCNLQRGNFIRLTACGEVEKWRSVSMQASAPTFRFRQAVPLYLDDMSRVLFHQNNTCVFNPPYAISWDMKLLTPRLWCNWLLHNCVIKFQEKLIMERTTFQEISTSE